MNSTSEPRIQVVQTDHNEAVIILGEPAARALRRLLVVTVGVGEAPVNSFLDGDEIKANLRLLNYLSNL